MSDPNFRTISGPWDGEPDRVEFKHAGLPCLMVRHPEGGHWCGYAGVPPSHPFHGVHYDGDRADETEEGGWRDYENSPCGRVEVHGGLTYSAACQGSICHKAEPGEPDDVWWFGFDCAHAGDLSPQMLAYREIPGWPKFPPGYETYRDLAYVHAETERLAEQLVALEAVAR